MAGFNDYLGAFDDYLGDDDILGAPVRRASPRGMPAAHSAIARRARAQLVQPMPGVPKGGPRIEPLGFPVATFVNAGVTTILVPTNPQKPFKGSRLVVDIVRTGGGTGGLVSVSRVRVGARDVLVNANPIPAAAFGPTAFGVELQMDEATPGVVIEVEYVISTAPGVGDTVVVGTTIMGLTWS